MSFWVIVVLILILFRSMACGGSSDDSTEDESVETTIEETTEAQETHIYDDAQIVDSLNGAGTSVIGQYSLIEADSSDITLDVLEDWYFNYVAVTDYDYYLIAYTDVDDDFGVYAITGMVNVGVTLVENSNGQLSVSGSASAVTYLPSDGSLVEYGSDEEDDTTAETSSESDVTLGMSNALSSALSYLNYTAFSYTGLIEQLEYEGYTEEEATYAVDNCGADWYEQALEKAGQYLEYTSFSRSGQISQLEYEGFTTEQAEYAVDAVGY